MLEPRASISQLQRLLDRQKKRLQQLQKRKGRLISEIARVDEKITALLGRKAVPRRVRRRKRGRGLQQFIFEALKASPQPKSAAEIAQAITEAGYRSFSKNLVALVRHTCYRSKLIQKKKRGKFAAGAQVKPPAAGRKSTKKPAK